MLRQKQRWMLPSNSAPESTKPRTSSCSSATVGHAIIVKSIPADIQHGDGWDGRSSANDKHSSIFHAWQCSSVQCWMCTEWIEGKLFGERTVTGGAGVYLHLGRAGEQVVVVKLFTDSILFNWLKLIINLPFNHRVLFSWLTRTLFFFYALSSPQNTNKPDYYFKFPIVHCFHPSFFLSFFFLTAFFNTFESWHDDLLISRVVWNQMMWVTTPGYLCIYILILTLLKQNFNPSPLTHKNIVPQS